MEGDALLSTRGRKILNEEIWSAARATGGVTDLDPKFRARIERSNVTDPRNSNFDVLARMNQPL
jgi:hypothetical protein